MRASGRRHAGWASQAGVAWLRHPSADAAPITRRPAVVPIRRLGGRLQWPVDPISGAATAGLDDQASAGPRQPSAFRFARGEKITAMTLDVQQQRMLQRLRQAGGQPVTYGELRADGITFPAAVASELELNGYAIDRVFVAGRLAGLRLIESEPPDAQGHRSRPLR
jgi:hypothetical protein